MSLMRSSLAAIILSNLLILPAAADIKVVASIKPVHSLVSGVMAGVGAPSLIVEGAGSPHTYALKPSRAQALQDADVIFWIGHELEPFLEKPLESLSGDATVVELMDTKGLTMVTLREGGAFEGHTHEGDEHGHSEHGHEDEAKHEDDDHEHGHSEDAHEGHDHGDEAKHDSDEEHGHHDDHDAHEAMEVNVHIWLDPMNAKIMVGEIARKLAAADPANAALYAANAKALAARIDGVSANISELLKPVRDRPFVVFHDAYQHFESRFGLNAVGSITVSPEVVPGAARISEIRAKIIGLDAACVFSEPQFTPKLVSVVTEGTRARQGVLDPLGADLTPGPDLYVTMIENLGANVIDCLSPRS